MKENVRRINPEILLIGEQSMDLATKFNDTIPDNVPVKAVLGAFAVMIHAACDRLNSSEKVMALKLFAMALNMDLKLINVSANATDEDKKEMN